MTFFIFFKNGDFYTRFIHFYARIYIICRAIVVCAKKKRDFLPFFNVLFTTATRFTVSRAPFRLFARRRIHLARIISHRFFQSVNQGIIHFRNERIEKDAHEP